MLVLLIVTPCVVGCHDFAALREGDPDDLRRVSVDLIYDSATTSDPSLTRALLQIVRMRQQGDRSPELYPRVLAAVMALGDRGFRAGAVGDAAAGDDATGNGATLAESCTLLIEMLGDPDPYLRAQAVEALFLLAGEGGGTPARVALEETDWNSQPALVQRRWQALRRNSPRSVP